MKNALIASLSVLLAAQTALAWSISIGGTTIKGDDPQIVKDAEKAVKHGANQVANGVRDVFAVVGNATGLTDVIDSNTETFANIGRGYACMATLCYSEVLRKKQLDEAEAEAKRGYDRYVAERVQEYETSTTQENREKALSAWKMAESRYNILLERHKLTIAEFEITRTFLTGVNTEINFRKKLAELKVTGRPLKNREMIPASEQFAKSYNQDYNAALNKLNDDIAMLSQATKRTHAQLMAEFLRIIELDVLAGMAKNSIAQFERLQQEIHSLNMSVVDAAADSQASRHAYEQEQY
ncbi:hypothetical protein Bb109J_c2025 [Bdellovibrio bacteriovorus]|uniref:hypothetical protein n=1 Tax=Bdellovibrio bacteriovorus TaxID=959 RepID=UPI00045BFFAB|nr:hypothetical protein [Bdellovibrio bacteriovorus]AHZ84717.1 hypothetical protein EP01_07170 [Bdellovibrio bacteriovorus]BEV68605.1 hypothetical protein Bb109J_c2025 [Bdellovibrio bacteriovorus]